MLRRKGNPETSMNVDIKIERSVEVDAPFKKVAPLLDDLEGTIRRFPKLRKMTKIGTKRSEARRVGKECGRTCRYRWTQSHKKKQTTKKTQRHKTIHKNNT